MFRLAVVSVLFSILLCSPIHALVGHNSDIGEFSSQAVIKRYSEPNWVPHCGGVIISDRHVLTAASCAIGLSIKTTRIFGGDLDTVFTIKKIRVHELYFDGKNDIAIIEVAQKFTFSSNLTKIQLDHLYFDDELETTALGIQPNNVSLIFALSWYTIN